VRREKDLDDLARRNLAAETRLIVRHPEERDARRVRTEMDAMRRERGENTLDLVDDDGHGYAPSAAILK
jgi:hypothetical protein